MDVVPAPARERHAAPPSTLDVLGVDDQISTGQHDDVWATCQRFAEPFTVESWPLTERTDVLTELVLRHGFTVGWALP